MAVLKLIVEEFETTEENKVVTYNVGEKYSYFVDPETGKYYRPVAGFTVISDTDLLDRFVEVEVEE